MYNLMGKYVALNTEKTLTCLAFIASRLRYPVFIRITSMRSFQRVNWALRSSKQHPIMILATRGTLAPQ